VERGEGSWLARNGIHSIVNQNVKEVFYIVPVLPQCTSFYSIKSGAWWAQLNSICFLMFSWKEGQYYLDEKRVAMPGHTPEKQPILFWSGYFKDRYQPSHWLQSKDGRLQS
jgi:hypothetical protein